jgi:hypothetical protein
MTDLLAQLKGVARSGDGWIVRCPAHDDRHNSLSIHHRDGRWLLRCHAGCGWQEIVDALRIDAADLFDVDDLPPTQPVLPRSVQPSGSRAGIRRNCSVPFNQDLLPIFPCAKDKSPLTRRGYLDAIVYPGGFAEFRRRYPSALPGVPMGKPSGLFAVDIDPRHNGDVWLEDNQHRLPPTWRHQTGGGGWHLLYQWEEGLTCHAGRIAEGIDERGAGGYIIFWAWVGLPFDDLPIARFPSWLWPLPKFKPKALPYPKQKLVCTREAAGVRLAGILRYAASPINGRRHRVAFNAGVLGGHMVADGQVDEDSVIEAIVDEVLKTGLEPDEAERTVRDGVQAGREAPNGR